MTYTPPPSTGGGGSHGIASGTHTAFPGGSTTFLRGDATFAIPPTTPEGATDHAIRYVSAAAGNDANNGLSATQPKATIASAYSSLPAEGGAVFLFPGRHDVGAGLAVSRNKHLTLYGPPRARRFTSHGDNPTYMGGTGREAVVYSSTGAARLIDGSTPASIANARGFTFRDIVFELSTTTAYAIYIPCLNFSDIDNCLFYNKGGITATMIYTNTDATLGDDGSWIRVTNNQMTGGGTLFKCDGVQHNRINIRDNAATGNTTTGVPAIYIKTGHGCVIEGNSFEDYTSTTFGTIYLLDSWACRIAGNSGERCTYWVVLDNSFCCMIEDPGKSAPVAGDRLVHFKGGSQDNLAIVSTMSINRTMYESTMIVDDDTSKRNWWFSNGGGGLYRKTWLPFLKSGTGTPEAAVWGRIGDLFLRHDGGATTTLYVKTSGDGTTTGWTAK